MIDPFNPFVSRGRICQPHLKEPSKYSCRCDAICIQRQPLNWDTAYRSLLIWNGDAICECNLFSARQELQASAVLVVVGGRCCGGWRGGRPSLREGKKRGRRFLAQSAHHLLSGEGGRRIHSLHSSLCFSLSITQHNHRPLMCVCHQGTVMAASPHLASFPERWMSHNMTACTCCARQNITAARCLAAHAQWTPRGALWGCCCGVDWAQSSPGPIWLQQELQSNITCEQEPEPDWSKVSLQYFWKISPQWI